MLVENLVRSSLRGFQSGKAFHKLTSNPIRNKYQRIPLRDRKHGSLQGGQLRTDDAATQQQHILNASFLGASAHQHSLNISDAKPGHHAVFRINRGQAQYHTTRGAETFVAALYQRNGRFSRIRPENGNCRLRGLCSFFTMPNSVHRRDQDSISPTANQVAITRFTLAGENKLRHPILHQGHVYCFHFFTVTIVPRSISETISNSSIKRRTPGSPRPRLPDVEKPSLMA